MEVQMGHKMAENSMNVLLCYGVSVSVHLLGSQDGTAIILQLGLLSMLSCFIVLQRTSLASLSLSTVSPIKPQKREKFLSGELRHIWVMAGRAFSWTPSKWRFLVWLLASFLGLFFGLRFYCPKAHWIARRFS